MNDSEIKCCVCLLPTKDYTKIYDLKKGMLITKLQNVVPEVEWIEDYNICQICTIQLEQAFEFRTRCIQLDYERKFALIPKSEFETQVFRCDTCAASFTDKEVLIQHVHTHEHKKSEKSTELKFGCDNCDKAYFTQKVLKAHVKRCRSKDLTKKTRTFSCEVCDVVLSRAKDVVEHCFSEHSMDRKVVKPYTCDECPMRFSSSANLIQHKKYHGGSRCHICSFCGKSYITKSDLTVHEYTHFNRRNYKCEFCPKAFNTNKNLRTHILVVHTDHSLWKYGCDFCDRRFPLKSGYDQHMKRHTGDKRFICHICNKSFVSKNELQKHMDYHSMVRPFKCEHCDKSYREKRLYNIHLTKSHGIGDAKIPIRVKKYVCHICPSAFCNKQKLERHLRSHLGLKPFECPHCDKKYSDRYHLKRHMKNVHNLELEPDFLAKGVV